MDVFNKIYEILQLIYTFIPKELLLIILVILTIGFILNYNDRKKDGHKE
jgi:hypothetical protein